MQIFNQMANSHNQIKKKSNKDLNNNIISKHQKLINPIRKKKKEKIQTITYTIKHITKEKERFENKTIHNQEKTVKNKIKPNYIKHKLFIPIYNSIVIFKMSYSQTRSLY